MARMSASQAMVVPAQETPVSTPLSMHRRSTVAPVRIRHPAARQPLLEHRQHLRGLARGGKDAAAAFGDHGESQFLEKIQQFRGEKAVKGLAEKGAGRAEMAEKFGQGGDVGQVAAALAGDAEFAARTLHFFQDNHLRPKERGLTGGHQAGGAAPHDHQTRLSRCVHRGVVVFRSGREGGMHASCTTPSHEKKHHNPQFYRQKPEQRRSHS